MTGTDDPSLSRIDFARESLRSIAIRYGTFAVGFAGSVVIARAIEASGRGAYAFVITLAMTTFSVAHLSVEQSYVVHWSREDRAQLLGAGLVVAAIAGTIGALATDLVAFRMLDVTSPVGVDRWMVLVGLGVVPAWMGTLYADSIFVNEGRIATMNRIALAVAVLQTTVLVALASAGVLTVSVVILLWSATTVVPLVPQLILLSGSPGIALPSLSTLRKVVATGLRYHLGLVALSLVLRVDVLLLAVRVPVAEVGIYSLAVTLTELALRATTASSQVAVQVQIEGAPEDTAEFTAHVARINGLLAGALVVLLSAIGPFVIEAVFGPTFAGTTRPIAVLAPGIVALSVQRPLGVFVTRLDRPWFVTAVMVTALGLNVALNLALIPHLGIVGAAVASTIVYVGLLAWNTVWFTRVTDLSWRVVLPRLDEVRALAQTLRGS